MRTAQEYGSLYRQRHAEEIKEARTKDVMFKGKSISLKYCPRIGVCNLCRAVVGTDCKRTHIHHEEYDENNPLAHTIELCVSCHVKLTWELGQSHFKKYSEQDLIDAYHTLKNELGRIPTFDDMQYKAGIHGRVMVRLFGSYMKMLAKIESSMVSHSCDYCGTSFRPSKGNQRFCTRTCNYRWSSLSVNRPSRQKARGKNED